MNATPLCFLCSGDTHGSVCLCALFAVLTHVLILQDCNSGGLCLYFSHARLNSVSMDRKWSIIKISQSYVQMPITEKITSEKYFVKIFNLISHVQVIPSFLDRFIKESTSKKYYLSILFHCQPNYPSKSDQVKLTVPPYYDPSSTFKNNNPKQRLLGGR